MKENRPGVASSRKASGQPDRLKCPSHERKKWTIDKIYFDWHRWVPLRDHPNLRWALAIVSAVIIVAIMIVGIVFTAEYYSWYYASGAWVWAHAKTNITQTVVSSTNIVDKIETLPARASAQTTERLAGKDDKYDNKARYIAGIRQTTLCDPRWSCARFDQPERVPPPLSLALSLFVFLCLSLIPAPTCFDDD
ncbi:hypothetical protein BKA67DRAFT_172107 [Truncatella angustata]|uniref:Uncharacterized protein n=1 Tax=Truncatella angustata TaxID=152316 RepID=A0A9P8URF4_9PEZI|nr:uncharacterized protein BKA67DRAFT_172107 [Truncatella angustata]KAH6656859.1 hypothetical protein BKA67DRAFT_172107 [Truncatella angustata]KAH8197812.1 hypothetical protein TruAng_008010 [Truncatella angustata]